MSVFVLSVAAVFVAASIGTAVTLWVCAEIDERRWRRKYENK